jgi:hypothetical protein
LTATEQGASPSTSEFSRDQDCTGELVYRVEISVVDGTQSWQPPAGSGQLAGGGSSSWSATWDRIEISIAKTQKRIYVFGNAPRGGVADKLSGRATGSWTAGDGQGHTYSCSYDLAPSAFPIDGLDLYGQGLDGMGPQAQEINGGSYARTGRFALSVAPLHFDRVDARCTQPDRSRGALSVAVFGGIDECLRGDAATPLEQQFPLNFPVGELGKDKIERSVAFRSPPQSQCLGAPTTYGTAGGTFHLKMTLLSRPRR